jgi:hypothetical protein
LAAVSLFNHVQQLINTPPQAIKLRSPPPACLLAPHYSNSLYTVSVVIILIIVAPQTSIMPSLPFSSLLYWRQSLGFVARVSAQQQTDSKGQLTFFSPFLFFISLSLSLFFSFDVVV